MKTALEIQRFLEYGIKAPSGHNTQPWKFSVGENEIRIHPDFERALPIVDGDNHALYISLGCASENIILAARNSGYDSNLEIRKDKNGIDVVSIELQHDGNVRKDDLFNYIDERQVTRNAYEVTPVPKEDLKQLLDGAHFKGIQLQMYTTKKEIDRLEPFIIEGSNHQFENREFVNELVSWIRFTKKEIEQKGDGIWHASMGLPRVGRTIGSIIMTKFVSAKSEAKRWEKLVKASAGFVLFTVDKNDVNHWVTLGRAFQRFGLTATKLNINHAHVNMPCEEIQVREKMKAHFGLTGDPLLMVRFGYSERMPYSFRRSLEGIIVKPIALR